MARRFKPGIKIYLLLILFFLLPLLILIGYNSCGLESGFQPDSLSNVSLQDSLQEGPTSSEDQVDQGGQGGPAIVFPNVSNSPCATQNEYDTPVNAIPIQINLTNRNSNVPHVFSVECKKIDGSFEACGNINASDPNAILEITNAYFNTVLGVSSGHSQGIVELPRSVINIYSDTIHYKKRKIEVKASDGFGNELSRICTWKTLPEKSEFVVRSGEALQKKPVDILFVIDHSVTMYSIERELEDSFKGFIGSLSGLDWRIAVISMESKYGRPYYFGQLLMIHLSQCPTSRTQETDKYILAPLTSCSDFMYCSENIDNLQNTFIHTIKCPPDASSSVWSHLGIQAAYETINLNRKYFRFRARTDITNVRKAQANFFRNDATLVMVFLTDTPNCGPWGISNTFPNNLTRCDGRDGLFSISSTHCYDYATRSKSSYPQDLVQKVGCIFGENKKFFVYPIIPTTFSDAEHYVDLAKRTQGRISDWTKPLIRIDDRRTGLTTNNQEGKYTAGLRRIKGDIASKTIRLKCRPSDEVPVSGGRPRIPSPIYLFRPDGETTFERILPPPISPGRGPKSHEKGTFMVTAEGGGRHLLEIIEYWKIEDRIEYWGAEDSLSGRGNQLNKVRFIPAGEFPTLPEGTYRVEYSCADSQE